MTDNPHIRASDDERNRVIAALSEAFAQGRIDYAELDERTEQVWRCRYREELITPLEDLFPDPTVVLDTAVPAVIPHRAISPASTQVTGESGGSEMSLSMMGGNEKSGDWLCAPRHTSLTVMGGNYLDLRSARLTSRETEIVAVAVMGGIEIVVPEDVRVVSSGLGIMGGFGITTGKRVTTRMNDLPADAPVIRVSGVGLMGSVTVVRKPRKAT